LEEIRHGSSISWRLLNTLRIGNKTITPNYHTNLTEIRDI
jgi:hypothetical protein